MKFVDENIHKLLNPKTRKSLKDRALKNVKHEGQSELNKVINLILLAECFKFDRQCNECLEAYKNAINLAKDINFKEIDEIYLAAGYAMVHCKQMQNAIDLFTELLTSERKLHSDIQFEATFQIAHANKEMKNYSDAKNGFNEALNFASSNLQKGNIYEHLAYLHDLLADQRGAIKFMELALSIYKNEKYFRNWNSKIDSVVNFHTKLGDSISAREAEKRKLEGF